MITRKLLKQIEKSIMKPEKKIIFIWGPRQIGKSTILNFLYQNYGGSYFNFDDLEDQRLFVPEITKLKSVIQFRTKNKNSRLVFIDEVQKKSESTQAIKLLTDRYNYIVVATGSAELRAKSNYFDTLAGRYKEYILFPLTVDEHALFRGEKNVYFKRLDFAHNNFLQQFLEEMMIYGGYPGVVLAENKIEELKNISQNSIVKDIVNIYDLKSADLVFDLLRLLAMQIGNLINVTELASALRSSRITIDNYLNILEKNRIIFFFEPYKVNKRRGYLERRKVYFYDLGIRNSLVGDFRPLNLRADLGAVFENLIIGGIMRQNSYLRTNNKLYFYRQIGGSQKELDLIVELVSGRKLGYEIKYRKGNVNKFPDLKINNYENISRLNAPSFLI